MPRVIKARWVSAVSYVDGAGAVQLRFSAEVVPYITRLEAEFTRYKLEKVAKMSSAYAIRLYELLMQWGNVGRRDVELEWLKKILMVDKDYGQLDNFKKRVLDVALSQINENSDLTASYTQRKTGRNVTHLIFTFAPKEEAQPTQTKPQNVAADVRDSALFQRLRGHGIGPKLAAAWIKQDEARVLAAVEYVEARAKAEREALARAQAAIKALPTLERLMLAEEYRQGAGAGRSASWDAVKGDFRAQMERIQFNAWLQPRFKAG